MRPYAFAATAFALTALVLVLAHASPELDSSRRSPPAVRAAAVPSADTQPVTLAASVSSQYRDATPPANPIFSDDRDAAPPPAALPPPREEAGAVTSFVVQSQESEQLAQIDARLAAALQEAADEARRRQAVAENLVAQHTATLDALDTLRRSEALLASGDSDGVDDELARAEAALSGRTRLDVEAAREALARSDLYPARQNLEAALAEKRVPR